ncbi:hypothetical protein [Alteromonas sp. 14N.309.X.WAT.G.H12]|uniref:hypothetical protein n=1 Tax=Alteromonas sp. 14N.309.X.WAT.G.H12 TaxID=3120824 RepID=UPI002FD02949
MFADQTYVGSKAGTKTVVEAHIECLSGSSSVGGDSSSSTVDGLSYDSDYGDSYKECMAEYVPFKVTGSDAEGACGSESVTWGQCSSTLPTSADGAVYSARHSSDNDDQYEGVATFQCSDGDWTFLSGGCAEVADPCEDGLVTSWDVTTPTWADSTAETVYTDKFGQIRHDPKDACYARMDAADSGELVVAIATTPETTPEANYDLTNSTASKRCFNDEWIEDSSGGSSTCTYVPSSCSATTYTHPNGCSFSIPTLDHDEIYTDSSPSPSKSVGSIQAYCWDGDIEIKSASCNMSCEASVSANTWSWDDADDARSCYHAATSDSERIAPTGGMSVSNTTEGLEGSSYYTCNQGEMTLDAETCSPSNCTVIPANSWTTDGLTCAHDALVVDLYHGDTIVKRPSDVGVGTQGEIVYECEYGEIVTISKTCSALYSQSICYAEEVNPDDPTETVDDGYEASESDGTCGIYDSDGEEKFEFINGQCCEIDNDTSNLTCFEVP